ncbi:MAG: lactonase family protein, partial [Cyclobacteriaceae bacterium]|nr:lactonase family protein [Cyclobacteriaceae bacterium]
KVISYPIDQAGNVLTDEKKEARSKPGSGPRHLSIHPSGKYLYLMEEISATIQVYKIKPKKGQLRPLQKANALPPDFDGGKSGADIHVHPNGRFLYSSNRGHNSIAIFSIDQQKGTLTALNHQPSGGDWPRNFTISPDGQYLLVANRRTDNIVVFSIDPETGLLSPTGHEVKVPGVVSLLFK